MNADIEIIPFEDKYKTAFVELTRQWLEEYFFIEPCDEELFADPAGIYIKTGGEILMAIDCKTGCVAGTCSLVCHPDEGIYEMSKLAVKSDYRRHGIAERLVDAIIVIAKKKRVKLLYLDTSVRLEAAVRLYRRKGFVEIPLKNSHYKRTDMQMVKDITV